MPLMQLMQQQQRSPLGNSMPQNQMMGQSPQLQGLLRMLQGLQQRAQMQQGRPGGMPIMGQSPQQPPQQDTKKNLSSFLNIMKTLVQSGQLNG
jgi:hypothetical protein